MEIKPKMIKVRDLVEDYFDNQEGGVVGYGGNLDIRPPYQREFVYKDKQRDAVIETLRKDFPLNVMYWAVQDDGTFEVIDGQQRTISICQYVEGDFSVEIDGHQMAFHNLQDDQQEQILNYELMVYLCEGTPSEKLAWFKVINIAGEKLTDQELRNAVYHGSWVSAAKKYFSKNGCPAYAIGSDYMTGSPIRQDYLETAIEWITADSTAKDPVDEYMRDHQHDPNANPLWLYFKGVIDWVETTFPKKRSQMKSVEWGPLYNKHKDDDLDPTELEARVAALMGDLDVKRKPSIYEFLLGGELDTKLLEVRVFDERTKLAAYERQTAGAEADNVSNCPTCAAGSNNNAERIYKFSEMDADHVTAWSRGGATDISNCEMLCVPHNRSKGNR